ncbi:TPA: hypothetical protein HA316_05680, partial [Candidatus Micrarchaeota archaeon]|nr:hypothetical protein [Candidatus Micrarchaeota archaeon]
MVRRKTNEKMIEESIDRSTIEEHWNNQLDENASGFYRKRYLQGKKVSDFTKSHR